MNELNRFIHWANKEMAGRRLVCHFYISESEKPYYSKTDYAYFNLLSDSRNWIVKGTTGHGIRSGRGKASPIPCLNLFEVNEKFFNALDLLSNQGNKRFDVGIIFNKRRLKGSFGKAKVVNVTPIFGPPDPFPSPKECHRYDWVRSRYRLWPFNKCDVVRLEIPESDFGLPIATIPYQAIAGMLIRRKDYHGIAKIMQDTKRLDTSRIQIFGLL